MLGQKKSFKLVFIRKYLHARVVTNVMLFKFSTLHHAIAQSLLNTFFFFVTAKICIFVLISSILLSSLFLAYLYLFMDNIMHHIIFTLCPISRNKHHWCIQYNFQVNKV